MNYLLEISNLDGGAADDEQFSRIESLTPIPIPAVGDELLLQKAGVVKVVRRLFGFHPATPQRDATAHVQLFCRTVDS